MWPVPSPSTPYLVAAANSSEFVDPKSFSKAGRKILVGDCALFKLTDGSPPFVGIIRRLIVGKEESITLSVNWFYRPADVILGEGALLGAAPNEVFYSFHEDEIPAASLLHPCKVAFLRKGVELPSGISSFVCRRVYDIENKCLWWLTDHNYINQRREINKLLDKTQAEMHGAAQAGGRSPKPLNATNGTTQIKPSSDNIQSTSPVSSLVKSKKREHVIHSPESVKRECLSKGEETDAGQRRQEHMLKSEIAKITDKGGLVDIESVEKLIQLMQPESSEKKVDLASRVMLVDVISVTDKFDCLGQFVHLRGLLILDEWLQEVHKGKIGDGSPKGNDKSVEEFLFALLRALDRLPVNLHALQTCNVGKSVNYLRGHKNSEIQKKARGLVDKWKKRVEAEMNIIETRSGTRRGGPSPNKSMVSEVSHVGSRRATGSSDADAKIATSQPSGLKSQQGKPNSSEAVAKSPESPRSIKPVAHAAAGTVSSDMPPVPIKEDKSGSSSPSTNNSQSCSSDHGKTGISFREDAPSSTSGSGSIDKISSGISHGRKSGNIMHDSAVPSGQKEGVLGKFGSVDRSFASGKGSPIRTTPERAADGSSVDNMANQRLIVRLPNSGRIPTHSVSGGSLEDVSTSFGRSPVAHPEKQEHHDRRDREKVDATKGNNVAAMDLDSCKGNEGLVGSDEAKTGILGVHGDEHGRDSEIIEKISEASKVTGLASDVTLKPGKSHENSYSSVNALIESGAKVSEVNVSVPAGDDVGMNLLASVAAGEMSRSGVSPVGSSENKSSLPEDTCSGNDGKLRQSIEGGCQSEETVEPTSVSKKQVLLPADSKGTPFGNEKTGECNAPQMVLDVKSVVAAGDASAFVGPANGCKEGNEGVLQSSHDQKNSGAAAASVKVKTQINDESTSWSSSEKQEDERKLVHKQSSSSNSVLKKEVGMDLKFQSYGGLGEKAEEVDKKTINRAELSEQPKKESDSLVLLHSKEHGGVHGSDGLAPSEKLPVDGQDDKPCVKHTDVEGGSSEEPSSRANVSSISTPETVVKLDFDLNEVLPSDDGIHGDVERPSVAGRFSTAHTPYLLPTVNSPLTGNRPASVTVAAAAKGPFFPSENLLRGKAELGWKGSAATSAFRPAEPRKVIDAPVSDDHHSKHARPLLDFDLNVGVIEDASQNNAQSKFLDSGHRTSISGGGLGLDLNSCEESPDGGLLSVNLGRSTISQLPPRSLLSGGRFSNSEQSPSSGFDLNNGPGVEETGGESSFSSNWMQFLSTVPNVRMNNMEMGNFSSWFPPGSAYPGIAIPPVLPGRGEQGYPMVPGAAVSQRMLTPATAGTSFNPEIFRGPVLSSSPAVAFPSTMPFQFPGFPFETNFPISSNTFSAASSTAYVGSSGAPLCFPTMPVGPSGVVSSPYRQTFMMGLPANVGPDGRRWSSQGLDLNAGPGAGGTDLECRDETMPTTFRQLPLSGSQAMADEQLKVFQQMAAGGRGLLKRKEPDDGRDADRISSYKPSWH